MKIREALSGAPLFRGRLAAVFWLWWSGFLAGDTDYGLVWFWIPDSGAVHHHPLVDLALWAGSIVCLALGVLSIDQYGRAAWFAWAPDDAKWGELRRGDVNRKPIVSFGNSFTDDMKRGAAWVRRIF